MKSYNCCISSGNPPSPNTLAPRMVTSLRIFRDHSSKGKKIELWSATNVIEGSEATKASVLSRIFRRIKPKRKNPLEILLEENAKSDKDNDIKQVEHKFSSTLRAVAGRIKEHIRIESTLGSRESLQSIGTSNEDIERRAELRRLRKQRIRDELSRESQYDIDAKSIPSTVDGLGISILGLDLSKSTPQNFRYPVLNSTELPVSNINLKSKANECPTNLSPNPTSNPKILHETLGHSDNSTKQGRVLTDLPAANLVSVSPRLHGQLRKFSPLPPAPLGPILQPRRLPSISESHDTSWQLLFGADCDNQNFAEQRRQISGPYTLESKGSPPPLVSEIDNDDNLFKPMSLNQILSQKRIGTGAAIDTTASIPLHQLGISQRSASSSSKLQTWKSSQGESLYTNENNTDTCSRYTRTLCSMSHEFQESSRNFFDEIPSFGHLMFDDGVPSFSPYGSLSDFFSIRENTSSMIEESRSIFYAINIYKYQTDYFVDSAGTTQELTVSTNLKMKNMPLPNSALPQEKIISIESPIIAINHSSGQKQEDVLNSSRSTSVNFMPITSRSGRFREEFNVKPKPIDIDVSQMTLTKHDYDNKNHGENSRVEEILDISNPLYSKNREAKSTQHAASKNGTAAKLREFTGNFRILSERSGNCPGKKLATENGVVRDAIGKFSAFKKDAKKSDVKKLSKTEEAQKRDHTRIYNKPWKIQRESMVFKPTTESHSSFLGKNHIPSTTEESNPNLPRITGSEQNKFVAGVETFDRASTQSCRISGIGECEKTDCFEHQTIRHQTQFQGMGEKKKYKLRDGRKIGRLAHKSKAQSRQPTQINGSSKLLEEQNYSKPRFSLSDCMNGKEYHHEDEIEEEFRRISLIQNFGNRSYSSSISNFLFYTDCAINQETEIKKLERNKFKTWGGKDGETNIYMKRKSLSSNALPRR
ncbi:hypothetical protein K3495_g3169 [Podosphaera aphanis]|nr:hypothetical protein K3495_g3169 [Podosphaera aphanis]